MDNRLLGVLDAKAMSRRLTPLPRETDVYMS